MPSLDEQIKQSFSVSKQQTPNNGSGTLASKQNRSILHATLDFVRGDSENYANNLPGILKNKKIIKVSQSAGGSPAFSKDHFRQQQHNSKLNNVKPKEQDVPAPKFDLHPNPVEVAWKSCREVGGGLHNQGNTCFLNSVLQCLAYTAPLTNVLIDENHTNTCKVQNQLCMLCELQRNTKRLFEHSRTAMSPMTIVNRMRDIGKCFHPGRQEDAHEFLVHLFDAMQKACLFNRPKLDNFTQATSLLHKIFGGFCRSQVICSKCSTKSNTFDPFLTVSIDIKQCQSIEQSLKHYTKNEILGNENMYKCEKCKQKVQAHRRVTFHRLPNVLVFHLKRFNYNGFNMKLSKHVEYPEKLNMVPYLSDTANGPDSKQFNLYAVLVHSGYSTHSGHYYCFVKSPAGTWYKCNDSHVSRTGVPQVLQQEAYLLFYSKHTPANRSSHGNNAVKRAVNGVSPAKPLFESFDKKTQSSPVIVPSAAQKTTGPIIGPQRPANVVSQKSKSPVVSDKKIPLISTSFKGSSFKIPKAQEPTPEQNGSKDSWRNDIKYNSDFKNAVEKDKSRPTVTNNKAATPSQTNRGVSALVPYSPTVSDEDDEESRSTPPKVQKLAILEQTKSSTTSSWDVSSHPPPSSPSYSNTSVCSTDNWRVSDTGGHSVDSDVDLNTTSDMDSLARARRVSESCETSASTVSSEKTFTFPSPVATKSRNIHSAGTTSGSLAGDSDISMPSSITKIVYTQPKLCKDNSSNTAGASGNNGGKTYNGLGLYYKKFKQNIKETMFNATIKVTESKLEHSQFFIDSVPNHSPPSIKQSQVTLLKTAQNSQNAPGEYRGGGDFSGKGDHNYVQQDPSNEHNTNRKRKLNSYSPQRESQQNYSNFHVDALSNQNKVLNWNNEPSRNYNASSKDSNRGFSNGGMNPRSYDDYDEEMDQGKVAKKKTSGYNQQGRNRNSYPHNPFQNHYENSNSSWNNVNSNRNNGNWKNNNY